MVISVETVEKVELRALPLVPRNPLSYWQTMRAVRSLHAGVEQLRSAGGPMTRFSLGPAWLVPPVVLAASPRGIRDVLGRKDDSVEKTIVHHEMRHLLGGNLFDLIHDEWLPRRRELQPVFTKQRVRQFAGHMSQAAEMVAADWNDGAEVDLDAHCRDRKSVV